MCFINFWGIFAQITHSGHSPETVLFRIWCVKWKLDRNVALEEHKEHWFGTVRIQSEYLWCVRQLLVINSKQ